MSLTIPGTLLRTKYVVINDKLTTVFEEKGLPVLATVTRSFLKIEGKECQIRQISLSMIKFEESCGIAWKINFQDGSVFIVDKENKKTIEQIKNGELKLEYKKPSQPRQQPQKVPGQNMYIRQFSKFDLGKATYDQRRSEFN